MKCKIDGCDREAQYKSAQLCQKHYFRLRRYGTHELTRVAAKSAIDHVCGYILVHAPGHVMAQKNGYVYEHRKVIYDIYGNELPDCEICGSTTSWSTCHIDHRDNNRKNNSAENLRPLCPGCNTWRSMPESHEQQRCMAITFDGKTDTPHGWSRDERVRLSGRQIRARKLAGMSDFDALFSPKRTHSTRDAAKPPPAERSKKIKGTI